MTSIGGAAPRDSEIRLPKTMKVKNKAAASRQITAEQILRESKEIQLEDDFKAPKTIITDPEELAEYRCVSRQAGGVHRGQETDPRGVYCIQTKVHARTVSDEACCNMRFVHCCC